MTRDRQRQIGFYALLEQQGWIPFKQWRAEEGERQGRSADRIGKWVLAGRYPKLQFKKINRKVVYVKP